MAEARRKAGTLIKLVHSFTRETADVDNALSMPHVLVFDEGQRAWDAAHMNRKHGGAIHTSKSESESILESLEAIEWALIVVLIGDGQEINTGEAGVSLWIDALQSRREEGKRNWLGAGPPRVLEIKGHHRSVPDFATSQALHLSVTRRSAKANWLSEWVAAVLQSDSGLAEGLWSNNTLAVDPYPLYLTRSLSEAKEWLEERRKEEHARVGLVASATSARLRPYGLETQMEFQAAVNWDKWFLDRPPSLEASSALEVAATQFKCQGLELDYIGLAWAWDLVRIEGTWQARRFRTNELRWVPLVDEQRIRFAVNAYRVLMTRARAGMVIWVPEGSVEDVTRDPGEMDKVAEFLGSCGVTAL